MIRPTSLAVQKVYCLRPIIGFSLYGLFLQCLNSIFYNELRFSISTNRSNRDIVPLRLLRWGSARSYVTAGAKSVIESLEKRIVT